MLLLRVIYSGRGSDNRELGSVVDLVHLFHLVSEFVIVGLVDAELDDLGIMVPQASVAMMRVLASRRREIP